MRTAARRQPSVEALQQRLDLLSRERQALHERRADRDELEANRLAIVQAQWDLSRALVRRYLPVV